jgi:hypothetical protein
MNKFHYMETNDWMRENGQLERLWKESIAAKYLVLNWYLPGEHEENHENI